MAISRVELNNYLVFKDEFVAEFCSGVNVLIGANGTGKTTLLRAMSSNIGYIEYHRSLPDMPEKLIIEDGAILLSMDNVSTVSESHEKLHSIYIPEKDVLEHAKGLLTFIEQKQTGFSDIYRSVLIAAQDVPTNEQTAMQIALCSKIADVIGGEVHWDEGEGTFYTLKADGSRVPFSNEASGYKKFGFLGLLISSGQLAHDSVLFWDEPENSISPELITILVDVLLELSRNGVQIFVATHSELLASYFAVNRNKGCYRDPLQQGNISAHVPEYACICRPRPRTDDIFETISNALHCLEVNKR